MNAPAFSLSPVAFERAQAAIRRRMENRPEPLNDAERAEFLEFQHRLAPGGRVDDAVQANIEALGHSDTLSILTGQQCGLLGGPLYAFIKAAACVATAKALSHQLGGRRVVPIYWLAGDDHDFEEIRSFSWVDAEGNLVSRSLDDRGDSPRVPAFERRFGPGDADWLVNAIGDATKATEYRADICAFLRDISQTGESLETHAGRLMARAFAGSGLVFATPWLGFIRRRGAKLFLKELEHPLAATRLVIETGERLEREEGIPPALHRSPDALNFFVVRGRERCRARWQGDGPQIEVEPGQWEAIAVEALRAQIEKDPESFSPNVVTRPPTQDATFPTVAYVGGPGERAYFRQLREVYPHFGVAMPWIAARPGLTMLEPRVRRSLEKLGVSAAELIAAVADGPERERQMLLSHDGSRGFVEAIERLQSALSSRLVEVQAARPDIFTRSKGASEKLGKQIQESVERLLNAARQDADQASGDLERHLAKAKASLAPDEKPQERVLNLVVPFLINYGWEFAERLRDLIPPADAEPREYRLDLPLEANPRPELLSAASPEAKMWQGADI